MVGSASARDTAMAFGIAIVVLIDALLGQVALDAVDVGLVLAGAATVVVRRRAPRVVFLAAAALVLAYDVRNEPTMAASLAGLVATYTVVRAGHRLFPIAVVGPLVLAGIVRALIVGAEPIHDVVQGAILPVGWFVASGVFGEVSRQRAAYVQQVEQRALEAERTREETALRRAGEERLRIARELHDSLTHSISIIKVQAGVAVHLARKRGEAAPDALVAIEDASRDAMRELRSTLDVLRNDSDPAVGLDQLPALVERTGVPVAVSHLGQPRPLPGEVERAAYRIVQESLTNAARHAPGSSATVRLDYGADALTVEVDNDGSPTSVEDSTPGVGLIGMRERVTALGGQLRAGPRVGGGFSVRAEIPLGELP